MMERDISLNQHLLSRRNFLGVAGVTIAAAACGITGCDVFSPKKFTLLCPDSMVEECRTLADRFNAAGQDASLKVESISEDSYTPKYLAKRMNSNAGVLAVLDSTLLPSDISGVDLYETTSYFYGENPDSILSLNGDEKCFELPLCGTVNFLLCNNDVFTKEQCKFPSTLPAWLQDMQYFESLGYKPVEFEEISEQSATVRALVDSLVTCGVADYLELSSEDRQDSAVKMAHSVIASLTNTEETNRVSIRDELLSGFQAGASAMMIGTSREYQLLIDRGVACTPHSIPGITDETSHPFLPTLSLVASKRAEGTSLECLYNWLVGDGQQAIYDFWGELPVSRNVDVSDKHAKLYNMLRPDGSCVKLSSTRLMSSQNFNVLVQRALEESDDEPVSVEEGE